MSTNDDNILYMEIVVNNNANDDNDNTINDGTLASVFSGTLPQKTTSGSPRMKSMSCAQRLTKVQHPRVRPIPVCVSSLQTKMAGILGKLPQCL